MARRFPLLAMSAISLFTIDRTVVFALSGADSQLYMHVATYDDFAATGISFFHSYSLPISLISEKLRFAQGISLRNPTPPRI